MSDPKESTDSKEAHPASKSDVVGTVEGEEPIAADMKTNDAAEGRPAVVKVLQGSDVLDEAKEENKAASDVEEGADVGKEALSSDANELAKDKEPKAVAFSDSTKEERSALLASSGLASTPEDDLPFESHFTVRIPTSTLQYRGALLRVIDTDDDQIILRQIEDDEGKKKMLVKRISPETLSQKILRIGYTLVTILFCGFLFVFCFQVLLLLIIAVQVYSTSKTEKLGEISGITMLSTLLAFPMMLYSMSSLMAMGSAFVMDTWRGGTLFRSGKLEMLNMLVFLVAPFFTLMICLMIQYQEPWRMAAGVWCALVLITFCAWSLAITVREVKACFWLVEKLYYQPPENGEDGKWSKIMNIAKMAFIKSQTARYSGTRKERYHVAGTDTVDGDSHKGFSSSDEYAPVETKTGIYSRMTVLSCCSSLKMFDTLDPPKRIWKSNEFQETPNIVTRNNWVMQRMWCGAGDRSQKVVVANGPYALTPDQIKYSGFCTVLSSTLMTLTLIGFLVWMEMGVGAYLIIGILAVICIIYPIGKQSYELHKMYESVNLNEKTGYSRRNVSQATGTTLYQVWETVRITQPKESYCIVRGVLEVSILFLWPLIAMLVLQNWPVAIVFFVMGSFSLMWRYFDSTAVLTEHGTLSSVNDKELDHSKKYFFSTVGEDVINNKGRNIWSGIFVVLFLAIVFLFLSAQKTSDEVKPQDRGPRPPVLLVDDFYYPPTNDTLAYPTCKLMKGFTYAAPDSPDEVEGSLLGDYAFLSAMAYETASITEYSLEKWLGEPGILVDEEDFVSQWRIDSGTSSSPVYFKLFTVTENPKYAIMAIRGSETSYDWIVNMQLWSSAGLSQTIKWLTPFGWIWSPILPDLIHAISFVESKAIRDVAYYRVTTQFVNDVLGGYGDTGINKIYITGASLGGGLAVITGAQTEAYTVAISGLGAKLSRRMFDPPIELDALNDHTFNYIPERDYIARIGGRQQLYQNAKCGAPKNNLFGCHSMWRSVCEINFRCGTNGRPVVCKCVSQFGYPEPVQNGTRTFEEACNEAQEEWDTMF